MSLDAMRRLCAMYHALSPLLNIEYGAINNPNLTALLIEINQTVSEGQPFDVILVLLDEALPGLREEVTHCDMGSTKCASLAQAVNTVQSVRTHFAAALNGNPKETVTAHCSHGDHAGTHTHHAQTPAAATT